MSRDISNRMVDPYNWEKLNLTAPERELVKQMYLDEVRYVDHEVGRLISALQSLSLYEDSLIILTSDHGEEFWDHEDFFHGHSLYNELLQVPLLVKMPQGSRRGRIAERVANQSVMGTILEMCGLPPRDDRFEFPSLFGLLEGRHTESNLPPVVAGGTIYGEKREAIISEDHKIITETASGLTELYDISLDSAERTDLSGEHAVKREELLKTMETERTRLARIRETASIAESPSRQVSPGALERLKSLGYVQ